MASSNNSSDWNDLATPARARFTADCFDMSTLSSTTWPSAEVKPLMASMSDVLPAPFGPIKPVTMPGAN